MCVGGGGGLDEGGGGCWRAAAGFHGSQPDFVPA